MSPTGLLLVRAPWMGTRETSKRTATVLISNSHGQHSKIHYFTVMTRINSALGSYRNLRFQTNSLMQNDRTNIPRFLQSRDIYDRLVSQKVLPPKAEEKWLQENIEIN